jgi:hypothetical protein
MIVLLMGMDRHRRGRPALRTMGEERSNWCAKEGRCELLSRRTAGSMNHPEWCSRRSQAAEHSNAENVAMLRDFPDVAAKYEARWEMLWRKNESYKGK